MGCISNTDINVINVGKHVLSLRVVKITIVSTAVFIFSLKPRPRLPLYCRKNDGNSLFFFFKD